jgi:hypothetical protein
MKHLKFIALILFSGLVAAALPAAAAQEVPAQNPLLMVRIPDIEKLLEDIQSLAPETPGSNASGQMDNIRMMLGGTDWIDTGRSITIGVAMENSKTSAMALIPFIAPNDLFRTMYDAQERPDYYLVPLPPQQEFISDPVLERKLVEASGNPVEGSLIMEAAAGNILAMVEPLVSASLAKMPEPQTEGASRTDISGEEVNTIIREIFAVMKQAETLRFGMDMDEEFFTVLMDIDARPGTELAAALIDVGGNSRLMHYPIDMPLEYHTRAYNITGTQNLMRSYLETVYGMLGLDLEVDKILEMSSIMTGETAAGFDITPSGVALKMAAVLKPGADGEAFIRDSYIPLMMRYGGNLSNMVAKDTSSSQTITIEQTENSFVGPAKVMGVKVLIHSVSENDPSPLKNMEIELRMASVDDLIFIASSDAEIGELIDGTRNLVSSPYSGPTGSLVIDLSKLMTRLEPLVTQAQPAPAFPEDLGRIETSFEIKDGTLTTRSRFNMDMIRKMISAVASQIPQGGASNEGENTGNPGKI